jgi:hypothetical protein
MIGSYRKRPVVIEAIQLTPESFDECVAWIGDTTKGEALWETNFDECLIVIDTLEGQMDAHRNDWIIKGVKGEFYPCKPDIFELTYEKVTNE